MNNLKKITLPNSESYFCWKEHSIVEGEDEPRLLTPWGDPMMYEFAADFVFNSIEEAEEWKKEHAPNEDWILCKETLNPIKIVLGDDTE